MEPVKPDPDPAPEREPVPDPAPEREPAPVPEPAPAEAISGESDQEEEGEVIDQVEEGEVIDQGEEGESDQVLILSSLVNALRKEIASLQDMVNARDKKIQYMKTKLEAMDEVREIVVKAGGIEALLKIRNSQTPQKKTVGKKKRISVDYLIEMFM